MRMQLYDGKTALPFGRAVLLFFKAAAARCAYYLFIKKSLPKEAFFLKATYPVPLRPREFF